MIPPGEHTKLSNSTFVDVKYTQFDTSNDVSKSGFNISQESNNKPSNSMTNKFRTATILSSSLNLINCNLGIGSVGLSYAVLQSGWILAIIFFIIFHFINHITMYMMMEIGRTMPISSYAIVCSKCKVSWLYILSEYSLIIELILANSSYLIIIGDFSRLITLEIFPPNDIKQNYFYYNRRFWILIFLIVFILPTTMLRTINSLRYVSLIGLLCFIYFVLIVFIYVDHDDITNEDIVYNKWFSDVSSPLVFFRTMSLIVMAYGGHQIAFAQTSELKQPTLPRISKIVWIFSVICTFCFTSIAFGGYYTFGNKTEPNLLLNYPSSLLTINILRIALCVALSFSYSVLANTIKNSMASIIFGIGIKNDKYSLHKLIYLNYYSLIENENDKIERENKDVNTIKAYKFYILVFIIIISTLALSLSTNNLGFLFQLNGATAAAFNQIIFPAMVYYFGYKNLQCNDVREHKYGKVKYYLSIIIATFGTILVPFMVYFAFDSIL
eukprot:414416_1